MRKIIIWLLVTMFVTYAFCLNTAAAVFGEVIKKTLHASDLAAAVATGAFIVGFACAQIPAGYLLDRFNARWVVSIGVLLLAVGNLSISYSTSISLFSLSNLIQGIGGSFAFIAAGVLISQWFSAKQFPIMFGLTQSISCIMTGIFHYVMVESLKTITWNTLYQYLAIYGSILFLLTIIFVKSASQEKPQMLLSLRASLTKVCQNKQIILCAFAATTSFGALLAYASFWYTRVQEFYSVDTTNTFIIGGILFAGIGIGTPLLGFLSNVVKSRKMITHLSLVTGTMMLLAGIYLPHFGALMLVIAKIMAFLIGFLLSGSMLFYTMVSENTADNTRGVALSVTNTGVFLFNTAMLFFPYLLQTNTSSLFFTYLWIFPICILISILVLYFINETYALSLKGDEHVKSS